MRQALFLFIAGVTAVVAGACARPVPEAAGPAELAVSAPTVSVVPSYRETGVASWYGREMDGRTTASGTLFDMRGISAAHRTLPLGTVIRVTNLDNFKTISVQVTDRGPFARGRILELSYGAARELGFVEPGTASVRIETEGPVPEEGVWTVHAAAFAEEENAKVLKYRLSKKYRLVEIVTAENNLGTFYRVRVGHYLTEEKAERIAEKLKLDGLEPMVMRKDEIH